MTTSPYFLLYGGNHGNESNVEGDSKFESSSSIRQGTFITRSNSNTSSIGGINPIGDSFAYANNERTNNRVDQNVQTFNWCCRRHPQRRNSIDSSISTTGDNDGTFHEALFGTCPHDFATFDAERQVISIFRIVL